MSAGRVPMSLSVCRVLAWGVSKTSLSRLIWIDLTDLSFIISEMYSVRVSLLNLFQNLSLIFTFSSWENLQLDNTFLTDSRDSDLNLTGNDLHREGSRPASFHLRQTRIMLERSGWEQVEYVEKNLRWKEMNCWVHDVRCRQDTRHHYLSYPPGTLCCCCCLGTRSDISISSFLHSYSLLQPYIIP